MKPGKSRVKAARTLGFSREPVRSLPLLSSGDNIHPMTDRDHSLDTLLELDGVMYTVDDTGCCWVKFEVARIDATPERPHGLKYSLTLHDEKGTRLLGFDNAHPIREGSGPGARTRIEYDHKHAGERIRFYDYMDAATLLADFWTEVETVMKERSESDG
jgi:Family of unknown function (DUF6516)